MILAVVGSRNFNDKDLLFHELDIIRVEKTITKVISGGAAGADTLAIEWAKSRGIDYDEKSYFPEWGKETPGVQMKVNKFGKKYNPIAGHLRNSRLVDDSDLVVAFWDYKSTGTHDSIKKAKKAEKLYRIIKA